MKAPLFRWIALAIGGLLLAACQAALAASPPLVTVEWLQANRGDVVLLDASSTKLHAAGHIPGAVSVDLYRYGAPHKVTPAQMEARIQSWGVSAGRKVVVHDEGGGQQAPWLFFELYYHGFPADALFLLDGGLAKWKAAGGAVTQEPTPAPAKGTFRVSRTREEVRSRLDDFLIASGDRARHALVDALEPAHHYGDTKFFDRAGHVPNAVLMPWSDFYNPDKTFKPAEEIRRMGAHFGIDAGREIHSHCGGGVAATVPFFAFKFVAGHPKVKVYKESQLEWLRDERGLPFWTYGAPNLQRDMGWVNSWNNPMMRMYGVSQLSVIDVRPAEAYRLNHVPYSLSIPADVFRAHLDDPAKLAALLGPSGIDPAHEAVIVSEGGLNPRSALAFLALEKLGQKKVSVLLDSVDDWGMRGHPLTKEPTTVGRPKSMQDIAVPPAAYPAQLREGVVGRGAGDAKGSYPRVFLASGKSVPANAPDGKVVHLPYSELLTPEGRPRPANEIWKALAKAGVPRYAEIVCFSDDPGEAAVNYYLLKLMGFPDVKVQLS